MPLEAGAVGKSKSSSLQILLAAALLNCSLGAAAMAWERATVGSGIEKKCEASYPNDWSRQTKCVDAAWRSLRSFSPPLENEPELYSIYKECQVKTESEFDFVWIVDCFDEGVAALNAAKQNSANSGK